MALNKRQLAAALLALSGACTQVAAQTQPDQQPYYGQQPIQQYGQQPMQQYVPQQYVPPQYAPQYAPQYNQGGYTGYRPNTDDQDDDYRFQSASPYFQQHAPWPNYNPAPYAVRPRFAYAPAGTLISANLATAISTETAQAGDTVQATVSQNVPLQGLAYIPMGSTLEGQVTASKEGRFFSRSGLLDLKFTALRLPTGQTVPIVAHLVGKIGTYSEKNGEVRGEGWGTKVAETGIRSAIGAAGGALMGTAIGAMSGHGPYYGGYGGWGGGGWGGYGSNIGAGALYGTAIGGGIGLVDALTLRRGRNVMINVGSHLQLQLDQPIQIPLMGQA